MSSQAPRRASEQQQRFIFGSEETGSSSAISAMRMSSRDLTTSEGRAELVEGVTRLSGGRIDGIVANAGGGPPQTSLQLNFFGAVATLEGLRPLLKASSAPRAVAVSSIASFGPADPGLVKACLSMDERAAIAAAWEFAAKTAPLDKMTTAQGMKVGLDLYGARQAFLELLVPQSRGQTAMGWRRDSAERGCSRIYRHARGFIHPFRSRPERGDGADGADARGISSSSRADGRDPGLVREPGKFADDGTNPVCGWWR